MTNKWIIALALGVTPAIAHAQRTLVFSDTNSARIEMRVAAPSGTATIVDDAGKALWSGPMSAQNGVLKTTASGLHPRLWTTTSPTRYTLITRAGTVADTVRFGFRVMQMRDGLILFNGKPLFIRGNAINPPGRTIPDSLDENPRFVADYIKYMKSINVNMIRMSGHSEVWLDACDSLGMLVYQGLYGTPPGWTKSKPTDKPFPEAVADIRKVLEPLVNHASVVVYVLSNELASRDIIHIEEGADTIAAYMNHVYRSLRDWDSTRVYIGNAGYGYGRDGDLCDTHHYWGYYYNTVLSYYTLRDPKTCWRTDRKQPLTISEGVASYTGPDGRFNIVSDSKQMSSQLNFTGHTPLQDAARRDRAYQAFVVKNAIEIMRRTRAINPYNAGLMPFTTLFSEWWRINSFADMTPSPASRQFAVSYQPVLLSWELWTPQVYAGTTLKPTAHVVNDDDHKRDLKALSIAWQLVDSTGVVKASGVKPMGDVAYYGVKSAPIDIVLPRSLAQGTYTIKGVLSAQNNIVSRNEATVFVAPKAFAGTATSTRKIVLFDPAGRTAAAFTKLGIAFTRVTRADALNAATDVFVVGQETWNNTLDTNTLRGFVRDGGRVLVLAQDSAAMDASWLNARLTWQRDEVDAPGDRRRGSPYRNAMAVNPEWYDHPVFDGIDRDRLFLWSDANGWNERRPGFPAVYPVTRGFVADQSSDLKNMSVIANYGRGLEGIAMAELFDGKGSVLLSAFDFTGHVGADPVADRMLNNLLAYEASSSSHNAHHLITSPIVWGDYASERGIAVDVYNGLILHTVPVIPAGLEKQFPPRTDKDGFLLAGGASGWNTRPAIQYVGRGRRPFGPAGYDDVFGAFQLPKNAAPFGTGTVYFRVPASTKSISTTVENPVDVALELEMIVNGVSGKVNVPAGSRTSVKVNMKPGTDDVELTFRGDRRLVLVETTPDD